jgi:hypothetical protein
MASYPEVIILERGSQEYNHLARHSGLIQNLFEDDEGNIELSADLMFPNETKAEQDRLWGLFVDIFFPELGIHRLFIMKNTGLNVDPKRGTLDDVRGMVDYMMVDEPETMMNFAKAQARKTLNIPAEEVPRGAPNRRPGAAAAAFAARQANLAARNAPPNNWEFGHNNWNNNNEGASNNSGDPRLGHREENNEYLAKVSTKNWGRFGLNERRKKNRRTRRRQNRKNRKQTRRNRK